MARQQKDKCGCKTKDERYVFMCEPCKVEYDETHARWAADYKRGSPFDTAADGSDLI